MEFLLGIVLVGLSLIVLPFAADPYQPVRALIAGAAIVAGALALRGRGLDPSLKLPAVLLGVLGVLYGAAALAGGPASALFGVHGRYQGIVAGALYVAAGILGATVLRRNIFALVWPLAAVASIHTMIVIVQRLSGSAPTSTTGNQVLAAGWLAIATATLFAAALVSSGRRRLVTGTAAAIAAVGLGVCGSRGAWVGLVIALLVAATTLRSRKGAGILAAVGVALVLGAALLGGPTAIGKLDPPTLASGSAASRWQIWRGSAAMVAANPLLGVGPGRFLYEFPRYEPLERAAIEYGDVRADQAHGEVLHVATEAGLLAALLLLTLVGIALVRGYRASRSRDGTAFIAFVGLCAAVGQGLFGITTIEIGVLAWVLGGVSIARPAPAGEKHRPAALPESAGWTRAVLVLLGVSVVVASAVYVSADTRYARGLDLFAAGQLESAALEHRAAQRLVPVVDTFRVAEADAALYLGGIPLQRALDSLDAGLALEPGSYDLSLARARVLKALDKPVSEVADAYVSSVELYPLGVEVRREAVQVLYAANRDDEAAAMERELARLQTAAGRGTSP